MQLTTILIALGLLIFLSHVLNALFHKIRISHVLVLILIGLLVGPVLGWMTPAYLGQFGSVFTTITLIVILFESGTSLDLNTLKKSILEASLLTILNFVVVMGIGYTVGMLMLNLDQLHSLFLGAALGGTSSAVVIPMVRQLKPGPKASTILYLESALSDVLCLVVALALLGGISTGEVSVGGIFQRMGISFLFAILLGVVVGFFWILMLKKLLKSIDNTMFTSFALAFILYGIAEEMNLNGGICILSYGIVVGNIGNSSFVKKWLKESEDVALNQSERSFFSEIVFIFQTYFFVYIGMSIQLNDPWHILVGSIFVVASFAFRPLTSKVIRMRDMDARDVKLISVMGPKGLVAAVLASLPLQNALASSADIRFDTLVTSGQTIQNVAYAVVLISIVLCSALVWMVDRKMDATTTTKEETIY